MVRRQLGADEEGRFSCPLPGHDGHAFVDLAPDDLGGDEPRLLCCRGRWRSLGEMRACMAYGVDTVRSNIELATWTRRLAYEVGAFAPLAVAVPALAPGADERTIGARAGFTLLVGLRWADGEHRAVAWSVRFAAAWCPLTHREAHRATRALIEGAVIVEAGRIGRVRLYLPGDPPAHDGEHALLTRLKTELGAEEIGR